LLHPAPGSRIEAAVKYGIDPTQLLEQLRLSPAERVNKMLRAAAEIPRAHRIVDHKAALLELECLLEAQEPD
jgi:hypothetical protein